MIIPKGIRIPVIVLTLVAFALIFLVLAPD
jgi:hypothetical protein